MKYFTIIVFYTLLIGCIILPQQLVAQYNIGSVFQATGTIIDDDEALPLNWLAFTANRAQDKNELIWQVANEQSIKNYVVEWSTDAVDWQNLSTVTAQIPAATNTYQFDHLNPQAGQHFYRIRSEEIDGRKNYSATVTVMVEHTNAATSLSIYPNPTTGVVNIVLPTVFSSEQPTELEIYDASGKLVLRQFHRVGEALSLTQIPAGTYQIIAVQAAQRVRAGFIKTDF